MTMGCRICVMNKGRIAQFGAPLEVYRSPADAFVAHFLGSPPMNLLPARLRRAGAGTTAVAAGTELPRSRAGPMPPWPFSSRPPRHPQIYARNT
jgi:multiple sugar transport system ATP-binding protein